MGGIDYASRREREKNLAGKGLYVFKNFLQGVLTLDRPTLCGKLRVPPGEEFTSDYSVMRLVRFGITSLVREIRSPEQEQEIMDRFTGKVFHGDALRLLNVLPTASVDAVITDPMYGTARKCFYEWGPDPARGDPGKHWLYHEPMYQECRRVLKPGGPLAWAQSAKFCDHFPAWFGGHRLWTLTRYRRKGRNATGHIWIVQTREQQPIEFPQRNSLISYETMFPSGLSDAVMLRDQNLHPCVKPVEEMAFIIDMLTEPGQLVLDCFCGLGSTLVAAEQLGRRWIGCDLGRRYCQRAIQQLAGLRAKRTE
jgi:site-specific DNA-methyltransferase (adenine-specific)